MSESASQHKKGIGELGPVWITAISGFIVALTGAGFFVGRTSAPESKSATATQTVTVTVPAGVPAQTGSPSTGAAQSGAPEPGVHWSGELTWGSYNLDFKPPRYLSGKSIVIVGEHLDADPDTAQLAEWQTDSVPGREQCAAVVRERGTPETGNLVKGSHVCGRTTEGRIFRVDVLSVESGALSSSIRSEVTIWAQ